MDSLTINNVRNVNSSIKVPQHNHTNTLKEYGQDSFTPSFKAGNLSKWNMKSLLKMLGISIALTIASLTITNCTKEPTPVVIPTDTPETPEISQEELDFAREAREKLESNPELLQSCLEYIVELGLIDEAILTHPDQDGRLFVAMNIIMGNETVKQWFIEHS